MAMIIRYIRSWLAPLPSWKCMGLILALGGRSLAATPPVAATPPPGQATPTAHIEFFFEAGCDNCNQVENEILPELEDLFGSFYTLEKRDVGIMTNYLRLAGYQERLGYNPDADVSMVVNGQVMLSGLNDIRNRLWETVDRALSGDLSLAPATPATLDNLLARVRQFTLPGVMAAGLVDGLNPCAVSTLVFFMSLLALLNIRGRQLLLAGSAFCAASFLTYFAIGLGLLRVLHLAAGFSVWRAAIDLGMTALLLAFAALSFRDAWRYRQGSDPNGLSLRLPRPIVRATHAVIRRGLRNGSLVPGAFGIGAAVTALESICTGQVYVPTLVLVMHGGSSFLRATAYLGLYNFMFILPLILVFGITLRGLQTDKLLAWSRRNVVFSKCLLGIFFLGLAALLFFL